MPDSLSGLDVSIGKIGHVLYLLGHSEEGRADCAGSRLKDTLSDRDAQSHLFVVIF